MTIPRLRPTPPKSSPSPLERLLTLLAVLLAAWILLTTINLARVGWSALPIADDWDRWTTFARDGYSRWWFFQQHVDHRLVAPKLLFAVDHLLFDGRGWFLLICAFCVQALTGIMLWRLFARICPPNGSPDRTEQLILAAVLVACLFSGQQWFNFVMPFQVQFPMVSCAALAALFALYEAARQNSAIWIAITIAAAAVSTYSMANGVLLWPLLLLAAFWLRMPRRWIAALAVSTLLLGPTYFYHFHRAIIPLHLPPSTRPQRLATFFFAHLGSPMAPLAKMLWNSEDAQLATAALPGILVALALLALFGMLWRRRDRFNTARAMLVFYCAFLAGTSALIAYGRYEDSTLDAFMPKYLTPPYILWASLLIAFWPILRRIPRAALYAALGAAMLLGVAIHQPAALASVRQEVRGVHLGEIAIVDNVADPEAWFWLFHPPETSQDTINFLRNNRLTLFTEEWTHWPGIPLERRFSIDRNPGACQGQFEEAVVVASIGQPGWRVTGWAWDSKAGRSPRYIVLGDDAGLVAGVALLGFPLPPALAVLPARYVASTWSGYVAGRPRPVTAYVLEADQRSLCAVGTLRLRRSGQSITFQDLGPALPVSTPEITGVFTPNGYYQGPGGPGAPPVEGPVFGSFPDGNKGSLRLGPFHLDGHTEIGIPLVTGPDRTPLSVVVRNAATQEVLAQISPPPPSTNWWVWHPDLPQDHEITIEILAEDKGSAWGQWIAIGWPHALKPM